MIDHHTCLKSIYSDNIGQSELWGIKLVDYSRGDLIKIAYLFHFEDKYEAQIDTVGRYDGNLRMVDAFWLTVGNNFAYIDVLGKRLTEYDAEELMTLIWVKWIQH